MCLGKRLFKRVVVTVLAFAGALAAPAAATGIDLDCPPCEKDRLLSLAPQNVQAILVVNNAAHQRAAAPGIALRRMLEEGDLLPDTRAAWAELSRTLSISGEVAFDELLGRRVALIMRGLDSPDHTQWAVLSQVSAATERRLRDRLRPAPRSRIAGLVSLSIESGRYELIVGPGGIAADAKSPTDAGAMILLGPGGDNRLMAELAHMLLRPMPAPPPGPDGRECDFVLRLSMKRSEGEEPGYILAAGTLEDGGWNVSLAASSGMLWRQPPAIKRIHPWTDAALASLQDHALLAVVGLIGAASLEGLSSVHALSGLLRVIPLRLEGEPFGQRAALYIREEPPANHDHARTAAPARASVTMAMAGADSRPTPPSPSDASPRHLSVGMAVEAADVRRMLLEGDQMIAGLMRILENGRTEVDQAPRVQLVVTVPDRQFRALRIGAVHPLWVRGMERAFGTEPMVTWGVRADPAAVPARAGDMPGWWTASIAPRGAPGAERVAEALTRPAPIPTPIPTAGRALPRLSMGIIRPAALERAVSHIDPDFLAPHRAMRHIDLLRWDAWQRDDGTVEATVQLRMAR